MLVFSDNSGNTWIICKTDDSDICILRVIVGKENWDMIVSEKEYQIISNIKSDSNLNEYEKVNMIQFVLEDLKKRNSDSELYTLEDYDK